MNRRHFIGALAGTAVAPSLAQSSESAAPSQPGSSLTRTPLVIMAPHPHGCDALWAVNQLCKGRIEWQSDDGSKGVANDDAFGFVPQSTTLIRVRVDGLQPGKTYRLRSVTTAAAGASQEISNWKTFRTLAPAHPSTSFVVWNDTHVNNETIQKLHDVTPKADFLFWNGDTCNDWKSPDLLIPTLLNPGERDITDGRGLFLSWGNHDSRGPYAFQMPEVVATPSGRPFYAFVSGPVAAVCLHTGEDKPDDHPSFAGRVAFDALRREQVAFLSELLRLKEYRDAPYRVVFCHIPLRWIREELPDYSKTGFDHFSARSRELWHPLLVEWKAQLIISGHTHRTEFIPANEQFPYAQVTGGGPQPKSATWMHGEANNEQFVLTVRDLDGGVRHEIKMKPLA
jgi:hypothetical protein